MNVPLVYKDIHGGITEDDVVKLIETVCTDSQNRKSSLTLVFFDEINTCTSTYLLKELICDRTCRGTKLPDTIRVLGACNPWREKQSHTLEGFSSIAMRHQEFSEKLTYQVHKLPDSLEKYGTQHST